MAILSRFLAEQFARPSGWIGRHLIGPWLDRIGERMNRLTLDSLEIGPSDHVLEIGFGGGALLAKLLERTDGDVIGVDLSLEMVERARRRFRGETRLRLVNGSVQALPLANHSVDKACSVNNVYFWPDPADALSELARVLKPGGRLSLCFEPPSELKKWPGHRFRFRLYEEAELRKMMAYAGFGHLSVSEGRGRKPDFFLCLTGDVMASPACLKA